MVMRSIIRRIDGFLYRRFGARLSASTDREFRGHSLTLRLWHETRPESARLHVSVGSRFLHAYFEPEKHDETFTASAAVPGIAVWFSADLHPLSPFARWCRRNAERETGIHVYLPGEFGDDLRVHWRTHSPSNGWDSRTPWWRDGTWNVSDDVFGRTVHAVERVVSEREVDVHMPERSYRWRVKITDETWKRPRSPFVTRMRRAHCEALDGEQIPIPGKGENDYDCDDDATYGSTFPARSVADAVGHIVADVTKTRLDRGWAWKTSTATAVPS